MSMQKFRRIVRVMIIVILGLLSLMLVLHWGLFGLMVVCVAWALWLDNGGTLYGDTKWE
jgi:hypothetical protein